MAWVVKKRSAGAKAELIARAQMKTRADANSKATALNTESTELAQRDTEESKGDSTGDRKGNGNTRTLDYEGCPSCVRVNSTRARLAERGGF